MTAIMINQRTRLPSLISTIIIGALAICGAARSTLAQQTSYWNNASGGSFGIAENWAPVGIPGSAQNVAFTNNADLVITFDSNTIVSNARFFTSSGNFTLMMESGKTWTVQNILALGSDSAKTTAVALVSGGIITSNKVFVGQNGRAALIVRSNSSLLVSSSAAVGDATSANASSVTISDAGRWTNSGPLYFGTNSSFNTLTISNGGVVVNTGHLFVGSTISGASNTILVSGSQSLLANGASLRLGVNGSTNIMEVTDGGRVTSDTGYLGLGSGSKYNRVLVEGNNSMWSNATDMYIGYQGAANTLVISNGGAVVGGSGTTHSYLGRFSGGSNNAVLVTGPGANWMSEGNLYIGYADAGNKMIIQNGGAVTNNNGDVGTLPAAVSNSVVISGVNSKWNSRGNIVIGATGSCNTVSINEGGALTATNIHLGLNGLSFGNSLSVSGPLSRVLVLGEINIGFNGSSNLLEVTDAASLSSGVLYVGRLGSDNRAEISGQNTTVSAREARIGLANSGNLLTVRDSAIVTNGIGRIGSQGGDHNEVIVQDRNSIWRNEEELYVGGDGGWNAVTISNGGFVYAKTLYVGYLAGATGNVVRVTDGGILESRQIVLNNDVTSYNNSITNVGGVFLFATNAPLIQPNASRGGGIVLSNGIVAFQGIANANVKGNWSGSQLTNIQFYGANTFRLNASSNNAPAQDYIFDANRGASNYVHLEMMGGATAWLSPALTIGSDGSMLLSNTVASVAGEVTNRGVIRAVNSTVVWQSNVLMRGGYISDPSTNVFESTLTVSPSGWLSGSNGDLFVFARDFINQSTNSWQFSLSTAAVLFTNSSTHLLSVSNSGSADIGQGYTSFDQVATNFAIGQLSIASGNRVTLAGNQDSLTNALYIGWLDIQGVDTNSFDSVTNGLFSALDLPNINLYYDKYDPRNGWLNANLVGPAAGGYDLWNGGLLLPIPEASTANLILASALLSAWIFRWRSKRE